MSTTVTKQQTINLATDVQYSPSADWNVSSVSPCPGMTGNNLTDHFTTVANASASLVFEGNRILINGARTNVSGTLSWSVDNGTSGDGLVDLNSQRPLCDTLADVHLPNGTHTLVMSLLPSPTSTANPSASIKGTPQVLSGQLHLLNITVEFSILVSESTSNQPSFNSSTNHLSGTTIGLIVTGVVVGVALLGGLLLCWRKKTRERTHSPNNQYPNELATDDGMREHRTTTTLSYGLTPHVVSSDDLPLMQLAAPAPVARSTSSATSVRSHSPPDYVSFVGDREPVDALHLVPPPQYEELLPRGDTS